MAEGKREAPVRVYDRNRNAVLFPEAGKSRMLRFLFSDLATIEARMFAAVEVERKEGRLSEFDGRTWTDQVEIRLNRTDALLVIDLYDLALKEVDGKTHTNKPDKEPGCPTDDLTLTMEELTGAVRDALFLSLWGKTGKEAYDEITVQLEKARAEAAKKNGEATDEESDADPMMKAALSANGSADVPTVPG